MHLLCSTVVALLPGEEGRPSYNLMRRDPPGGRRDHTAGRAKYCMLQYFMWGLCSHIVLGMWHRLCSGMLPVLPGEEGWTSYISQWLPKANFDFCRNGYSSRLTSVSVVTPTRRG